MVSTFVSSSLMKVGNAIRQPGELVPEAHTWRLVDHLLHSGKMKRIDVEVEDIVAAVEKYCKDDAEKIFDVLSLKFIRSGKRGKIVVVTDPVEVVGPVEAQELEDDGIPSTGPEAGAGDVVPPTDVPVEPAPEAPAELVVETPIVVEPTAPEAPVEAAPKDAVAPGAVKAE